MTPNGRFIYVANRGHDSLAGFAVDQRSGRLSSLGQTKTEPTPRGFAVDPSGRCLLAAGEASGKLTLFQIDETTGKLSRRATHDVGSRPWWVLMTHH